MNGRTIGLCLVAAMMAFTSGSLGLEVTGEPVEVTPATALTNDALASEGLTQEAQETILGAAAAMQPLSAAYGAETLSAPWPPASLPGYLVQDWGTQTSMSALPTSTITPSATGDGCDDTNSGWGTETAHCIFECDSGEYIRVSASVDDYGNIDGTTSCGKAGANCFGGNGHCDASSAPATSLYDNSIGSCSGTGNGGYWTRAYVHCWTQSSGSAVVLPQALGGVLGTVDRTISTLLGTVLELASSLDDPIFQALESELGSTSATGGSSAAILINNGDALGLVCDLGTCGPVIPQCVTEGDIWTCRIG